MPDYRITPSLLPAIDAAAPVSARSEIHIDAPPAKVWSVLTNLPGWPAWNSAVTKMEADGPIAPGTRFRWKSGSTITSCITHVEGGRVIAWTGSTMGIAAVHVWQVSGDDSGTRVVTEESFSGLLVRLLPGMMHKMLQGALDTALKDLKAFAER